MLVISRKIGEALIISDDIRITIVSSSSDKVTIGIEAPKDIKITREELLDTIEANKEASHDKLENQNYHGIAALLKSTGKNITK